MSYQIETNSLIYLVGLLLSVMLQLSGCADTPHADAAYGEAYRQMVTQQTLDINAASEPPLNAPQASDGQRVQKALDVYRGDVAVGSAEIKQQLEFQVGSK